MTRPDRDTVTGDLDRDSDPVTPRATRNTLVDTGESVRIPPGPTGGRRYTRPTLARHGTIVELTLGELVGQVENGGVLPFVFGSYGTG